MTETSASPTELPPAGEREHIHTRSVVTRGYLRKDGLWDLEAEIHDSKTYGTRNGDGRVTAPGDGVHHMKVRLTLDESLKVVGAVSAMPGTPFPECRAANDPVGGLVGATVGRGWRKAIDDAMGGVRGCTHLREMIASMATVAFQTIPNYRVHQRRMSGEPQLPGLRGHQMGQCLGWDTDGAVVARIAPEFIGYRPPPRNAGS